MSALPARRALRILALGLVLAAVVAGTAPAAPAKKPARPPKPAAAKPAPEPAAGPAEIAVSLEQARVQIEELRAEVAAASAESTLGAAYRAQRLRQAEARLKALTSRLDALDAQVTSLPTGLHMVPNLAGLNPDSLAEALARQFSAMARGFQIQAGSPGSQMSAQPGGIPWVDWKDHVRATPLPTAAERSFSRSLAPAPETHWVRLAHRFGDVRVIPSADESVHFAVQVTVQGTMAEAQARALAEQVRLDVVLDTALAALSVIPELRGQEDRAIRVDLTLQVPRAMGASVRNAYGDLVVANVQGPVECVAAYGDLVAHDLGSTARLEARNGDLKAERIAGAAELLNQSGEMVLHQCTGSCAADGLNSEMNLEDLRGGARLTAHNGSIRVRNVTGPLDITAQNVSGAYVASVRGPVSLNSQLAKAEVSQVAGTLTAQCVNGSLATSFVEQAQDLQTRFCNLRVESPGGDVHATGESAPMLLRLTEAGPGRHFDVVNRDGSVTLEVPRGGSANIQAATNFGTIYSDLPVSRRDTGDWQRAEAILGGGGAQVSLQAVNSSIRIITTGH